MHIYCRDDKEEAILIKVLIELGVKRGVSNLNSLPFSVWDLQKNHQIPLHRKKVHSDFLCPSVTHEHKVQLALLAQIDDPNLPFFFVCFLLYCYAPSGAFPMLLLSCTLSITEKFLLIALQTTRKLFQLPTIRSSGEGGFLYCNCTACRGDGGCSWGGPCRAVGLLVSAIAGLISSTS